MCSNCYPWIDRETFLFRIVFYVGSFDALADVQNVSYEHRFRNLARRCRQTERDEKETEVRLAMTNVNRDPFNLAISVVNRFGIGKHDYIAIIDDKMDTV